MESWYSEHMRPCPLWECCPAPAVPAAWEGRARQNTRGGRVEGPNNGPARRGLKFPTAVEIGVSHCECPGVQASNAQILRCSRCRVYLMLHYANLRCLQRLTVERHLPPNGALTRSFPVDILIQHVYVFISYLENIPDRPNIEPQIPTLLRSIS